MLQETGCDGVMIGRAALGNPWIFRQVLHYLQTGTLLPEPTLLERVEMAMEHARMLGVQECGPEAGPDAHLPGSARGQLVHYLKGMPGAAHAREALVRINTLGDALAVMERLREAVATGMRRPPREANALLAAV
jgi:tRNA-dihydrouridine synthase B